MDIPTLLSRYFQKRWKVVNREYLNARHSWNARIRCVIVIGIIGAILILFLIIFGYFGIDSENELSEFMKNLEVGWSQPAQKWLTELCPNVVDHFERFPSFKGTVHSNILMPLFTSGNASAAVCTIKVAKALAASIDTHLHLWAGSHLGAILLGQPIPWDDDVDAMINYDKKDEFLAKCVNGTRVLEEPKVDLFCVEGFNAIKVWLQVPGMIKYTQEKIVWFSPFIDWLLFGTNVHPWYSPFVDLWLFKITKHGRLQKVAPNGKKQRQNYAINDYFPAQPYYFGGIYVLGPQYGIPERRYNVDNFKCMIGDFNHMLETRVEIPFGTHTFDCNVMSKFPFRKQDSLTDVVSNGINEQALYPRIGATMNVSANINNVEIDNTISAVSRCKVDHLRVIDFTADGGKWWLESADLMKHADIIILNEMDIGMARSDQQHTTRQMAHYLGMNYAWTLIAENGSDDLNFHGLSGIAFMTKCEISNAIIFRDDDEKQSMSMFGQIMVNEKVIVIGAVNELNGHRAEIKEYINSSLAIVAGEKQSSFCEEIGLMGNHICSNLEVKEKEQAILPFVTEFGFNITLSDRAIISMDFNL